MGFFPLASLGLLTAEMASTLMMLLAGMKIEASSTRVNGWPVPGRQKKRQDVVDGPSLVIHLLRWSDCKRILYRICAMVRAVLSGNAPGAWDEVRFSLASIVQRLGFAGFGWSIATYLSFFVCWPSRAPSDERHLTQSRDVVRGHSTSSVPIRTARCSHKIKSFSFCSCCCCCCCFPID